MSKELEAALLKGLESQTNLNEILPGSYSIDTTLSIDIKGTLTKGSPTHYTPTAKIPYKLAMALLLEKSGITREHSINILMNVMKEAIKLNQAPEELLEDKLNDINKAEGFINEALSNLPKLSKSGQTRWKGTISIK